MSKTITLIADSANLQHAVASKHIVRYPERPDGKNSLDNFGVRINAGGSKLVKITSVPAVGYGAGKAKVITAINENGSVTLAEEEIPVMIPRL